MARAAIFLAAALTLAATVIGSPFAFDAVIVGQPAGQQTLPRIAASNDQFLAAWADTRDGIGRVWAARLDADASVLDPYGSPLSFDNGSVPAVASDGTGWLVVWRRDQALAAREELWGVRVDSSGAVGAPIPICLDAGQHPTAPEVAYDGTQFQVAFVVRGAAGFGNVMLASIDAVSGTVGGCGTPVFQPTSGIGNPRVAASPLGPLLEFSGALPDGGPGLLAKIGSASPAPLYDGNVNETGGVYAGSSGALWAWTITDGGIQTLLGRQLLFDGGWLDDVPRTLATRNFFHTVSGSPVDGGYTLCWTDWPQQAAARSVFVDTNTTASLVGLVAASGYMNTVDVATTASRAAVAYGYDEVSQALRVRVISANAQGKPLESTTGHPLATAGNAQSSPAIAASRTEWLVAWEDSRNRTPSIWAVAVAFDGTQLGAPFLVSGASVGQRPSVASDGTDFLVAFDDGLAVHTIRIGRSGLVGTPPLTLSPNGSRAHVVYDRQQYRVVWLRPGSTWTLQGQRLGLDDAGITLAAMDAVFGLTPFELSALGDVTLAVWPESGPTGFRGAFLSFDGGVVDGGVQLLSVPGGSLLEPQLLPLNDRWLMTWSRPRSSSSRGEGRAGAAFVFPDAGVQLLAVPELPDSGVGAVLALRDPVRLVYASGASGGLPSFDLTLAELGVPDSGQVISASPDSELPGAAAPTPDAGAWLLVEQVFDSSVQTWRLRARLLCQGACPVTPDAGVDAGSASDGGSSTDAGQSGDAGETFVDGGSEPRMTAVGCGCSGADGIVALAAALLAISRRVGNRSRAALRTGPTRSEKTTRP